ncbi:hypothetical protein ACFY2Y_16165 [Janibacter hoylei]|jgi:hypothetical protein|uniref:hypothetical protein n=1 Tax=Janibacter hoylei TaxID=364298 RepID=UPI0036CA544C
MSEYESDGVEETMQGSMRMAVTVAARSGAEVAMMRAQHARRAQAEGEHAAREFAQRREALWQDSRAELAPVLDDRWWQESTPEQISQAYATAQAWEGRPEVEPYLARIREQVKERYGIDVDEVRGQALEGHLSDPLTAEERQRIEAEKDRAEAARLMEDGDRADRATEVEDDTPSGSAEADHAQQAQADAGLMYDSAERRENLANDLRDRGVDAPVVEARVTADLHQATPASTAVTKRPTRTPKARRARNAPGQQRSDRGR